VVGNSYPNGRRSVKTIQMDRDLYYRSHPRVVVHYKSGVRYERVPEAAVSEIVKAKAGSIVKTNSDA
jgi:hypothetical protein